MDRYRDRSVMDRNRERDRENENRDDPYRTTPRSRREGRDWESFDRDPWQTREPEWDRDRYGRGGGYGQGSAGGFNEQQTSGYRSDYAGEDRWRPERESSYRAQYDRGGWGSGNASQTWGGGTRSAGAGYNEGHDRGRYGTMGSRENEPSYREYRDRDWNEDTRDEGSSHGIMESIGRFFGFGPKNYRRSDERITEEINDRLYRHPDVDASDVLVTVKEAEVTLSGTVDSRRAKYLAEEMADHVLGVNDVNNQLRVRRPAGSFDRGMGGASLGTTTGTTDATRDLTDPTRSRNK